MAAFSAGQAEIVLPSGPTLSGAMTLSGDSGARQGGNLVHTVRIFNVLTGESVTYTSPTSGGSVSHVITRVKGDVNSTFTGGKFSLIQGPINAIPGASFWFINPHGIIFGNGAALNGASSFHFSTADSLNLADGYVISATPPLNEPALTVAPPSAFGFLTATPAAITVATTGSTILRPPVGTTGAMLSLVGGPINVGTATGAAGIPAGTSGFILSVPLTVLTPPQQPAPPAPQVVQVATGLGGRVNLVSVASVGEATFDGKGFNVDSLPQLGAVNITQRSVVDGREVFIRAGQLTIDNGGVVPGFFARTLPVATRPAPPSGGEVNVAVRDGISVTGTLVNNQLPLFGLFRSGIYTSTPLATASGLFTPERAVPDINIQAGSVSISGVSNIRSERFGAGSAADVVINTGSLEVRNGASVSVNNFFGGAGGTLTINAQHVELSGDGNTGFTGIAGQSAFNPAYSANPVQPPIARNPLLTNADGAAVTINATGPGSLVVRRGAEISTDSFGFGRAGDLNIQASDIFLSRDGAANGSIAAQSLFAGRSGDLTVNATGRIVMSSGFQITGITGGTGDGGSVNVSAGHSISMDGANTGILSSTVRPPQNRLDEFAFNFRGLPGLTTPTWASLVNLVRTPALPNPDVPDVLKHLNNTLVGGVPVTVVLDLTIGDAGKLTVTTPLLSMSNGSRLDNSTGWAGNAGEIVGNLGSLDLKSGAQIRSLSGLRRLPTNVLEVGSGDAGKITINASSPATISISGAGSGISTTTFGSGDGGSIQLNSAGNVVISNGGSVTADSFGTGLTGDIAITAANSILMDGGTISTSATTSDGGNIKLTAPTTVQLNNSQITTSVQSGTGGGGNISIDPQSVILKGSSVTANAFGGPGGNIVIVAGAFVADAASVVEASSALSAPGTVQKPENNVAGDIAQLPRELVDASRLLASVCSARRAGAPSSFTVAGRGGVPVDPDGYLPSFSASGAPVAAAPRAGGALGLALAMAGLDCSQ